MGTGDFALFASSPFLLWEKNMLIDLHSHLLPNIDDGSKSLRASIRMAKEAVDSGIKAALMTPHHMNGHIQWYKDNQSWWQAEKDEVEAKYEQNNQ